MNDGLELEDGAGLVGAVEYYGLVVLETHMNKIIK